MDYNEMTYKSKSKIKSYTHNSRYKIAIDLCRNANSVFDYGTGSGYLLKLLSNLNPHAELIGYEPVHEMYLKAVSENSDFKNIKIIEKIDFSKKYDYVTCLEVFEHLVEADQIKIIQECKNLVLPWGKIVISVPIETGISGFFKNALRYIIGQSHAENLKEVFQAFFSMPVKRNVVNGYIYSHVGFRYKDLEKLLSAQNLKIKNRIFSPFNFLDRLFNSQVFYIIDANEQYTIRLTRKLASSKSSLPSLPTSDSMRVM